MLKMKRSLAAGLLVLGAAAPAFAQDEETTTPPAEGEATPDDGTGTPPTEEATPAMEPSMDAPAPRWARDVISRVLTQPKGMATVGLDLVNRTASFFDPAAIRIMAGYGITDDIEVAFGAYTFPTSDAGKGSIDVQAGVKILRGAAGGKLEMVGRVGTGYSLLAEGMNPLSVGFHTQYNITPKIAVITPGGHFNVGIGNDPVDINFLLPVALGFQATPELYLQFDTTLAQIDISNSANLFFGSDIIPLSLSATYNVMPALDVSASFVTDGKADPIGDFMFVGVGARYYIGQL